MSINKNGEKTGLLSIEPANIRSSSGGLMGSVVTSATVCGCCSIQTLVNILGFTISLLLIAAANGVFFSFLAKKIDEIRSSSDHTPAPGAVTLESLFSQTNVFCGYSCVQVCYGNILEDCFQKCYDNCNQNDPHKSPRLGWMGEYLQPNSIQHVGITVKNLTKTTNFFVDVLGGVLVEGAGGDGWFGNEVQQLLTQKELLDAKREGKTLEDLKIANLFDEGTDRLAATYVNFGSLQIEFLDYRARNDSYIDESHLPFFHKSTSPTIVNNMHVAFRIRDDVNLNQFVIDFEDRCNNHGYPEVECNRIVPVSNETERKKIGKTEPQYNSFEVKDPTASFDGWGIVYCKGVEDIQIEFNTVKRNAKRDFDQAFNKFICGNNPSCVQV